jgi:hypothetical protein
VPLRRGPISNRTTDTARDDLPLQIVPARGRRQRRWPLHSGKGHRLLHASPPGRVSIIAQGASRILCTLRHGTHLLGSRLADGVFADNREPRRAGTRGTSRSHVDGARRPLGQPHGSPTATPDGSTVMRKRAAFPRRSPALCTMELRHAIPITFAFQKPSVRSRSQRLRFELMSASQSPQEP